MRRMAILAIAFAFAACAPVAAPVPSPVATPRPLTKLVVAYGSINVDDLAVWFTKESGIFEQNGLDVDVQLASSSSATMAALLSGQAQIAQTGGSDAVSAAVGGADVLVVAVTSPVYSYVFEVPASITKPDDLRGKKVGVSTFGSSSDIGTRVALRKVGLDPDKDVGIVPVGDVPTRTAAMKSGAIQGTVVNPPETTVLEREGFRPLIDVAALKLPAALQSTIVQRSYATANRDVVQRYVDSLVQGIARLRKDKASAITVLKKYFKSNDEQAMFATYDFYAGEVVAPLPFPRSELFGDAIAELAKKNERVRGFDAGSIIESSFVQRAADRGLDRS